MLSNRELMIVLMLASTSAMAGKLEGDPTRPGRAAANTQSKAAAAQMHYSLDAIMVMGAHKQAVVNGVLVSEGERIGNAMVKQILANSIVLAVEQQGQTQLQTLTVHQNKTVKSNAAENY